MLLAFLVTLGTFKPMSLLRRLQDVLPVEVTIVVMGVTALLFIHVLSKQRGGFAGYSIDIATAGVLFAAFAAFSMLWTLSEDYAANKIMRIVGLTTPILLFTTLAIAPDRERAKRFLFALCLTGVILALNTVHLYRSGGGVISFSEDFDVNYVGLAGIMGVSITITFGFLLLLARNTVTRVCAFGVLLVLAYAFTIAGARGPLLSTVVGCSAMMWIAKRHTGDGRSTNIRSVRVYGLIAILAVLAMMVAYIAYSGDNSKIVRRILILTQQQGGHAGGRSVGERFEFWIDALRIVSERPIGGGGIGSFPVLIGLTDSRMYPHNIVMETLAELGLVGFTLLGFLGWTVYAAVSDPRRSQSDPIRQINVCVLITVLTSAMFSLDLGDQRMLMAVIGLQAAIPRE
ncbi:MAG: O-antigen ligase family protein [Planctomycetota bacterium]|nr:O-antigen ligase family protein [Planctomycetota bacterium]